MCECLHCIACLPFLSVLLALVVRVCVNGYVKTQTNHDDEKALSLIKHGVLISPLCLNMIRKGFPGMLCICCFLLGVHAGRIAALSGFIFC